MSGTILSTLAATVSATGISAPTMDQILSSLQASYQSIYGSSVYLGPDSQDGQWLGVIAQAIHDCNDSAIFVFNQFNPSFAIGTGLSSVVKINGLLRENSSNSTTNVTLVGQAGTILNNCLVGDNLNLGTQWAIPNGTKIPVSGQVTATVTCLTEGAVSVPANSLVSILTPYPGWQTVTNGTNPVTLGAAVESDATLRQRQSVSVAIPAQTVLASIQGGLANVTGVTRVQLYKNDTNSTDANGAPPHTITAVVAGGDSVTIAETISLYKTPGVPTYGTTTEVVFDSVGIPSTINFFILEEIPIAALIQVNPLTGYTTNAATQIENSIAYLINEFSIGETAYCGRLWGPANLAGDAATNATGQTQAALDAVSSTYSLSMPYGIAQSRTDLMIATAATATGAGAVTVGQGSLFSVGETIFLTLYGGNTSQAQVTGIAGNVVSFSPSISEANYIPSGGIIYVVADISIPFNCAASCEATDVNVVVL